MPSPDVLKQYHDIDPGITRTITEMAVSEMAHSHQRDTLLVKESVRLKKRGKVCAVVIAMTAIISGTVCILCGHNVSGLILGGVGLSGLVAQFLGISQKEKRSFATSYSSSDIK